MRFVENRVAARGNHFTEGVLPQRRVGAQQMVIDDDDVGFGGALPHLGDEAFVVARALGAQTRLGGRGDVVPEREVLRQVFDLSAVARFCARRPLADDRQKDVIRRGPRRLVDLIEPVQAEIVRAALHVGRRKRDVERFAQRWNVFEVDLLLEIFRAGRDQHTLAAENRGDEIRERLPCAGAGFRQQHAAFVEHLRDGSRHRPLAAARFEVGNGAGERTVGREDRVDLVGQTDYAGYSGNFWHRASTSARTMPSARSSSGVFKARVMNSAIVFISAAFMPRVVTAGVPMRTPLATIGGFWSNGIAFLLTVMPALPSADSATLPVMPFEKTSTSIR